jgi:hypothetical protein
VGGGISVQSSGSIDLADGSGTLVLYLICCLGLLRLRRRDVAMDGQPFRAPGGPFVPAAAAGIILWLLSTLKLEELLAIAALIVVSGLTYAVVQGRRATRPAA